MKMRVKYDGGPPVFFPWGPPPTQMKRGIMKQTLLECTQVAQRNNQRTLNSSSP